MAGGGFTIFNGAVSVDLARLTTTCPATAVPYGAGCTGSGGPNVLTTTALPWTGSAFRATATGMAPNSVAFGLLGFLAQSTPLSLLHPQGGLGCDLLANPDVTLLLLPSNGAATEQFAMPTTTAYAGVPLHTQVLQIELDQSFNITLLTSTNGLSLTIGAF